MFAAGRPKNGAANSKLPLMSTMVGERWRSEKSPSPAANVFTEASLKEDNWQSVQRLLAVAPRIAPPGRLTAEAVTHRLAGIYYDKFESPEKLSRNSKKSLELHRGEPNVPIEFQTLSEHSQELRREPGIFMPHSLALKRPSKIGQRLAVAQPSNTLHHVWLGDLLGAPDRLNLGRVNEAAHHYGEAIRIAEWLVSGDPKNEMAKMVGEVFWISIRRLLAEDPGSVEAIAG
jgi:hypothetical protein